MKLALVTLRCIRQTAPSVVSTFSPNILRMPYSDTSLGNASRRCVIWWISSAFCVYSMMRPGETARNVSVPSRSKYFWPVLYAHSGHMTLRPVSHDVDLAGKQAAGHGDDTYKSRSSHIHSGSSWIRGIHIRQVSCHRKLMGETAGGCACQEPVRGEGTRDMFGSKGRAAHLRRTM